MKFCVYLCFVSVFTFPSLVWTKEKTVRLKWNIQNEDTAKGNNFNFASILWPNATVHYYIWSSFTSSEKLLINQAIDEFRKHTCRTFTLFDDINDTYKPSLWIQKDYGSDCESSFGYTGIDFVPQSIYLVSSNSCMTKRGIVLHLLRTLGIEKNTENDDYQYDGDGEIMETSGLKPEEISAVNKLYMCSSLLTSTIPVKPTIVSQLIQETIMTTPSSTFDGDSFLITTNLWPNATVYYYIGYDFTLTEKDLINKALDELQKNTCVKFISVAAEHSYTANLVILRLTMTSNCSSNFGHVYQYVEHSILIGDSCNSKRGILVHLLRILGVERNHSVEDGNTKNFLTDGLMNSEISAVNSLYQCSSVSNPSLMKNNTATPPAHDLNKFTFSSNLWNLPVHYYIRPTDFTPAEIQLINETIEEVEKNTCIQFLPRSYVLADLVFGSGYVCFSRFGRSKAFDEISLSYNCMSTRGILRQLLRTLGIEKRTLSGEEETYDEDIDDLLDNSDGLTSEEIFAINYLYKCPSFAFTTSHIILEETKSTVVSQQTTQPLMVVTTGRASLTVNCNEVEWHARRAFGLADNELLNATNFLHKYLQFWFGGKWTVMYYCNDLTTWKTDFQNPNFCGGATVKDISSNVIKGIIFEHVPNNLAIKLNCDCWLTSLEVKMRRFSGNVQKAVNEIHEELKLWFAGSSFTILCSNVGRYAIVYTSEQSCQYVRSDNQTICYIYQH